MTPAVLVARSASTKERAQRWMTSFKRNGPLAEILSLPTVPPEGAVQLFGGAARSRRLPLKG